MNQILLKIGYVLIVIGALGVAAVILYALYYLIFVRPEIKKLKKLL